MADRDPYVRLAREAGKYKIGMIYSTQQVSSVEPDVLDNTANWIVAHLNSETEVKLLRGRYEFDRFAEQILHAEDVGFVRIKTQSSRYIIPVQVRLFDADMVTAARDATRLRGQGVVNDALSDRDRRLRAGWSVGARPNRCSSPGPRNA